MCLLENRKNIPKCVKLIYNSVNYFFVETLHNQPKGTKTKQRQKQKKNKRKEEKKKNNNFQVFRNMFNCLQ